MLQNYKIFLYLCNVNWEIIHIDETDSTNQWLTDRRTSESLTNGRVDEGQVVWTEYQTAGRGCGTNRWESERGKKLLFSLLISPEYLPANKQFQLSMAISLALVEALGQLVGDLSIKWPNDIYWRNGKLAGILIENTLAGDHIKDCIIGVGLNVNQQVFVSDAPNPVSLRQVLGHDVDREKLLRRIIEQYSLLTSPSTPPRSLQARYRLRLYRREGFYPYRDANGLFEAELVNVEDDGHLLLRDSSGHERRYAFKEVQFTQLLPGL